MSLLNLAARFPTIAANPIGAVLFSPTFWKIIFALSLLAGAYFGMKYMYDEHMALKDRVVAAEQLNVDLQSDLNEKQVAITNLVASIKDQQNAITRLNTIQRSNADALDKLRRKFIDRDIGADAIRDPVVVQAEVNKLSSERVRCMQLASGSTPGENEVNSVCPQLLKSHP